MNFSLNIIIFTSLITQFCINQNYRYSPCENVHFPYRLSNKPFSIGDNLSKMKEIKLTKGKIALIDNEDYEKVIPHTWRAYERHGHWYAVTSVKQSNGQWRSKGMHRIILNVTNKNIFVDHINQNGLDNRKINIRMCTHKENVANRISKGKSKYLGVCWSERSKKWRSSTRGGNGKTKLIGTFEIEQDAAIAYNNSAEMYFGEFANLNKFNDVDGFNETSSLMRILNKIKNIDRSRGSEEVLKERDKLINHITNKLKVC